MVEVVLTCRGHLRHQPCPVVDIKGDEVVARIHLRQYLRQDAIGIYQIVGLHAIFDLPYSLPQAVINILGRLRAVCDLRETVPAIPWGRTTLTS